MASGSPSARSFPQAVAAATRGFRHAARTQRHFRAQLVIAAAALLFAAWAGLGLVELAVLLVTVGLVLGLELLNTAVEMLTDLVHPDHGDTAAAVKDVSAAAVLTSAVLASCVGGLIFLPRLRALAPAVAHGAPTVLSLLCLMVLVADVLVKNRPPHG